MASAITAEEKALRLDLDAAARRLRTALRRCPAADAPAPGLRGAGPIIEEATLAHGEAVARLDALAQLTPRSADATELIATTRTALDETHRALAQIHAESHTR